MIALVLGGERRLAEDTTAGLGNFAKRDHQKKVQNFM